MATNTFESLGFDLGILARISILAEKIEERKSKSVYKDIRLMNKYQLIKYINKVRNSDSFNHVKANRYCPQEQREVSRMNYAQMLIKTNRVG